MGGILTVGSLSLDPRSDCADLNGRKIEFTAREFALFHYFMRHPGEILSKIEILENVWDANYDRMSDNVVEDTAITFVTSSSGEESLVAWKPCVDVDTCGGKFYATAQHKAESHRCARRADARRFGVVSNRGLHCDDAADFR
jgi:hypothetical protein